jgi:hypothetical protein
MILRSRDNLLARVFPKTVTKPIIIMMISYYPGTGEPSIGV